MTDRPLDLEKILADVGGEVSADHRAGLIGICGRPNVGKSTLMNMIVGEKVAIVTDVPGTTRNAIRGVKTLEHAQLIFLDTPGLAKPRTLLTRRLNDLVRGTWSGVDVVLFVVDLHSGVGRGDEYLAAELASVDTPIVAVANKADLLSNKERMLPQLDRLGGLLADNGISCEVVPVSAATGDNVDHLIDVLVDHLPRSGRLLSPDQVSDQPERQLAAEILREKLIARGRDELPHSIAVTIDEVVEDEDRDDLLRIDAVVHVERDSQKGIVIGKGGENLKAAATEARRELEVLFGSKVYLTTHVKVAKDWQRDPKQLGRLGY